MKREGPPLDSPVPWKRIKIKIGEDRGNPIYAEVEPFAFTDSRPTSALHRRTDPPIPTMNPFAWLPFWPPNSFPDSKIEYAHVPGYPLGNYVDFPVLKSFFDLETIYKFDPIDLSQYDCPIEILNEQFRLIIRGYDCWHATTDDTHVPKDNRLSEWMDAFQKHYTLIQDYMEKNMGTELNYFGLLSTQNASVYTVQKIQSYPQEWSNMVKLVLLMRFVDKVRTSYLIPWRNMLPRRVYGHENPQFGWGSVLASPWTASPDYDPKIARDWWGEKSPFTLALFSKDQLLSLFRGKKAKTMEPFLKYCNFSVNGGGPWGTITPVEDLEYRNFFNDMMFSKEEPFTWLHQQSIIDFYNYAGKNNVNNNIYTDCQMIFMVFAQMKRHTDRYFNNEDYGLLKNLPPSVIPGVPIRQAPPTGSIFDDQPWIKAFKEHWYDTSKTNLAWDGGGIVARKTWPPKPPTGFTQMIPPKEGEPKDRFFYNNIITFVYANPPPPLIIRPIGREKDYDPLFTEQWKFYMTWVTVNVRAYFEKGYTRPGQKFKLTPEEQERIEKINNVPVAYNTYLDIGIIDREEDRRWYEDLKWLATPITLFVEGWKGGSIWTFLQNRGKELFQFVIDIISKLIEVAADWLPKLLPILVLVGGGLLALTYGEEKVKQVANAPQ